jgi:RimJ/RimL family protein N-acetyltransferase
MNDRFGWLLGRAADDQAPGSAMEVELHLRIPLSAGLSHCIGPPALGSVISMHHLPIFDIRIRTERLELRLPDLELLDELATLAAKGVHPPGTMPFSVPWTDLPSPDLERGTVQWNLLQLGSWRPEAWSFNPVVLQGGEVIGTQGISATDFADTRTFKTGSWLGIAYQGRGIGREMRAAILHFGFVCLQATVAESGAYQDNLASLGVSRSLGYEETGQFTVERRGRSAERVSLRLTRAQWELTSRPNVRVDGVDHCLNFFGV